jgi:phage tail sheath protein FI
MPTYRTPGIYMEEVSSGPRPIQPVGTNTAGFLGPAPDPGAHLNEAFAVNNWSQFMKEFVPASGAVSTPLSHAVAGFFQNGGHRCYIVNIKDGDPIAGSDRPRRGLKLLEEKEEISIIAAPGYSDAATFEALLLHCENMRYRVAILDPPRDVSDIDRLKIPATAPLPPGAAGGDVDKGKSDTKKNSGLRPRVSPMGAGAFYFPWIYVADVLSAKGDLVACPPSGHMAGIWARTDATRGVHKAPANEIVRGALNVTYGVTGAEQGDLNSLGINCIRFFPQQGITVWGARTVAEASSEWRYLNVRRLFNMVELSLVGSTQWVVFEPNDRSLHKAIRRDISAFLTMVWRDGALVGATPEEAFFVKCDEETNPPDVIDAGQVITLIGLAPVKPAEFIVFRIGQQASGAKVEAV